MGSRGDDNVLMERRMKEKKKKKDPTWRGWGIK